MKTQCPHCNAEILFPMRVRVNATGELDAPAPCGCKACGQTIYPPAPPVPEAPRISLSGKGVWW